MSKKRLWGLSLLERNLKELEKLGITKAVVLLNQNDKQSEYFYHKIPGKIALQFDAANSGKSLRQALCESNSPVLLLAGNGFNDRRILQKFVTLTSSCAAVSPNGINPGAIAVLTPEYRDLLTENTADTSTAIKNGIKETKIPSFDFTTFDPYLKNLRRSIPPFLMLVEKDEHLKEADNYLKLTVHKGTNDFVATYIHPPLEFGLTRFLVKTPVTPNQITLTSILISVLVVYLFASGKLIPGIILAALKCMLDGVDGKLARLLLKFSKSGDLLDHVGDTLFDALWYLALGWHFSDGDLSSTAAIFAGILFFSYCVERIVPGIFKKLHGCEIYDYEKIDRFIRVIGSRMNNNVWLMMPGFFFGFAIEAFYFVCLWMCATAVWHTFRLVYVTVVKNTD